MRDIKTKVIIIIAFSIISGILGSIIFSSFFINIITNSNFLDMNNFIRLDKNFLELYILFFLVSFATSVYFLSKNEKKYLKYEEHNIEIMKGVFIPKPVKNKYQHGSSFFIDSKKFDEKFDYNILTDNKLTKQLILNKKVNEEVFEKYKFKSGGICLGLLKENGKEKIYYSDDDTHSIILGATRSGKGRNVLLQTIAIQGLAGENMVLSDPKGELYCFTKRFLENLGYEVIALDFEEPEKSNGYNFLQNVIDYINEDDMTRAIEAADEVVDMLVKRSEKSEPIWENGEKSILAFGILLVVIENKDKPEFQNLTNVYNFLSKMCVADEKGRVPLNSYIKKLDDDHPAKMKASISLVAPEKTRGSFFTSALATLRLFSNPFIYEMSKKTDFDINDTKKKRAIFIILPDQKETYNSLAGLFVSQYYNSLIKSAKKNGNRLERRVNFNLDEFGNYPEIVGMTSKMTVSAGYGIRFNLFIQSFSQFNKVYGEETAKTIKDNAETLIYLKSEDNSTLEEMSKKL